jgi:two-component system, NtrC family, nitrogen regulation sensor histidine kinase NtrY
MRKPLLYGFAIVALVLSVALVVWQGSFSPWQFGPSDPYQTFIFWAISSLIFVLMVTLGFMLFREGVKLYVERQSNREGSRIKTKLVVGALTLSFLPVFFLVLFSYEVLNHSLEAWFRKPADNEVQLFVEASVLLQRDIQDKVNTQAALLAAQAETHQLLTDGERTPGFLLRFSKAQGLVSAAILPASGDVPLDSSGPYPARPDGLAVVARSPVEEGGKTIGYVALASRLPLDVVRQTAAIEKYNQQWSAIRQVSKNFKLFYVMLMAVITLFVLFVATWIALFLSKQISIPITALLDAAREVRRGNLKHRVQVRATDELASLVRGFNQMTQELETSNLELDRRRRFTEAILESIPTGVISIGADGSIQRVNRALSKIFPAEQAARATRLEDLFSREDTAEIKYLMKRARRTGWLRARSNCAPRTASCIWRSRFRRSKRSSPRGSWWCSKTPASCCARRRPTRGTRWPAAWPTRSRIR